VCRSVRFHQWRSGREARRLFRLPEDNGGLTIHNITGGFSGLHNIEHAYRLWHQHDHPGWQRFGLTVTDTHQRVWLDASTNILHQVY
jgi:hypothetical protein